jgi:hypothetical protein
MEMYLPYVLREAKFQPAKECSDAIATQLKFYVECVFGSYNDMVWKLVDSLIWRLWCCAVGLHKILSLLESEDVDVRVHAVKVVANLAAEGCETYYFCPLSHTC